MSTLIRYCSIIFLLGVFLASIALDAPWFSDVAWGMVFITAGFALCFIIKPRSLIVAGIFFAALGFVYTGFRTASLRVHRPLDEHSFVGRIVFVEPQVKNQRLTVHLSEPHTLAGSKIYVYAERYPLYGVGSVIAFRGDLRRPEPFNDFAFDKFAAVRSIVAVCQYPQITQLRPPHGFSAILFSIKEHFSRVYNRAFHEPENAFIQAMVLARTGELSPRLRIDFAATGLTHVISISGLHISLIILVCEAFLLAVGVKPKLRMGILIVSMALYLILLGFPPPAVRSACMALLMVGAKLVQRPVNGFHILVIIATAMVIQNPLILVYDIGFQLSFLAILGLIVASRWWEKAVAFTPMPESMKAVIVTTFAAQTFTWPLTTYYFKLFSLIAPVTNAVIVALLAPVLIAAFALPIVSLVPGFGLMLQWPLFFMLKAMIFVATIGAAVPYAYVRVDSFGVVSMIASYGALIGVCLVIRYRSMHRKKIL